MSKSPDLLPRERVLEVRERLGPDGGVLAPLSAAEIARVLRAVQEMAPEAVATTAIFVYGDVPGRESYLKLAGCPGARVRIISNSVRKPKN